MKISGCENLVTVTEERFCLNSIIVIVLIFVLSTACCTFVYALMQP